MTTKTVQCSQRILDLARAAKACNAQSGEEMLPDAFLIRASVAFGMLERSGFIVSERVAVPGIPAHEVDDFDRAYAIVTIALNFTDTPPNTPHREALFGVALPNDYQAALEASVAGNRRALGLPPQGKS